MTRTRFILVTDHDGETAHELCTRFLLVHQVHKLGAKTDSSSGNSSSIVVHNRAPSDTCANVKEICVCSLFAMFIECVHLSYHIYCYVC